jgi:hypothetical protein
LVSQPFVLVACDAAIVEDALAVVVAVVVDHHSNRRRTLAVVVQRHNIPLALECTGDHSERILGNEPSEIVFKVR